MNMTLLLLTLPLLAACNNLVIDGETGAGGAGGGGGDETETSGGGSKASGGGTGATHDAVAMTRAQSDALWEAYWKENGGGSTTSSGQGGGGDLDPNDLFIEISDVGVSCGLPYVTLPCGGHWSLWIGIPPALQKVGVYDLDDPLLSMYSGMSETTEAYSPDSEDCGWGGGSLGSGILEIVSITDEAIQIRLEVDSWWQADPSGTYVASRCP